METREPFWLWGKKAHFHWAPDRATCVLLVEGDSADEPHWDRLSIKWRMLVSGSWDRGVIRFSSEEDALPVHFDWKSEPPEGGWPDVSSIVSRLNDAAEFLGA